MVDPSSIRLASGATMPLLGLGVFDMDDAAAELAVASALASGYRMVDTAAAYLNEKGVGAGVRSSGLPRGEVFVTTKLWSSDHANPRAGLERSLSNLGLDYVDLYLIHWPDSRQGRYVAAWEAMQELVESGLARSIGVSNFSVQQIDELREAGLPAPAVNQIERHPLHPQDDVIDALDARGVVTQAWSPFARGLALELPEVSRIAERHGRTPSQIILRWHLQRGVSVLPKSASPDRIRANADVWDFELTDTEMTAIGSVSTTGFVDESYYSRFA
jgi:2,5-diketo-D-gluconate reductase A